MKCMFCTIDDENPFITMRSILKIKHTKLAYTLYQDIMIKKKILNTKNDFVRNAYSNL